jgi:prepilin-type N-terminal cleavage/methylation domain-containing protein
MLRNTSNPRGFTLIEVMMVVLIFIIMISFAVINTNFLYTDIKQTEMFAINLRTKMKLAKQEAVLQQATLRFVFSNKEFGFQKLKINEKSYYWDWLPTHSILKRTPIKNGVIIQTSQPIEFYPNGRFKPFVILVKAPKQKATMVVTGDENGEIGVVKSEK